jgi:hypothetical protein
VWLKNAGHFGNCNFFDFVGNFQSFERFGCSLSECLVFSAQIGCDWVYVGRYETFFELDEGVLFQFFGILMKF